MSVFKVVAWDTGHIITEVMSLGAAKRYARQMGHTGEVNSASGGRWLNPVAYVANEAGECVYNPQFKATPKSGDDEKTL